MKLPNFTIALFVINLTKVSYFENDGTHAVLIVHVVVVRNAKVHIEGISVVVVEVGRRGQPQRGITTPCVYLTV